MILLINRRYPTLGLVLSLLSSMVFIALSVSTHHTSFAAFSALGIALSIVQFSHRRRHADASVQK